MPTPSDSPRSRLLTVVSVAAAFVLGTFIALQSRVNGELGRRLGDGYLAAVFSFGSGLVILAIGMLFSRGGRQGLARVVRAVRSRSIPWWYVVGGAAGALLVLSQGLAAATVGVALFTVAVVAGQTIGGLLIDARGLGRLAPKAVTLTRLAGAALILVAVVWAVSAQLHGNVPFGLLVLPLIAGFAMGWQQAVNGEIRVVSGSALTATFGNFLVGTVVLVVAFLIHFAIAGGPRSLPSAPYLYIGGVLGVVFIGGAAILVRVIGVLLLGLASIAGQLVMSLVLDLVVPVPGHAVVWTTVAGTLLTLVAVGIAAIPSRALRAAPRRA